METIERKPHALLINDIHVSKDNISEFWANWKEAVSVAQEAGVEYIIIGGDLWQTRSGQSLSTLMAVREALEYATGKGLSLLIAEGNHDKVDQESVVGYSHLFSNPNSGIEVIDECDIWDLGNATLCVMCYFPENGSFTERLVEVVESLSGDLFDKPRILYCHQGISGGLSSVSDDELPTSIFEPFDKVLVGHYHDRKKISGTNIMYIGASRQHNFGEDEEKGYTLLYSNGDTEFIKNQANIRYKTLDVALNQLGDELYNSIKQLTSENKYKVKVRINCKQNEVSLINKQPLYECGVTRIEVQTDNLKIGKQEKAGFEQKYDRNGIKEEYKKFCGDKDIDNVELGLHYLNNIK